MGEIVNFNNEIKKLEKRYQKVGRELGKLIKNSRTRNSPRVYTLREQYDILGLQRVAFPNAIGRFVAAQARSAGSLIRLKQYILLNGDDAFYALSKD